MAYFDSAKNRALWQKELDGLRRERSEREASGFADGGKRKGSKMAGQPGRVRITYAQLEQEVYGAVRSRSAEQAERRKEISAERSGKERVPEVHL